MKPILFADHFGWLHLPPDAGARGVVLCKPPGHEAQWLHRTLLALAQELNERGVAALIFDYLSSGDSLDDPSSATDAERWLTGIAHATDYLREVAQVEHVSLCGVRLGAALAACAAQRCGADGLMLVAPVVTGRAYLREARVMQQIWLDGVPPVVREAMLAGKHEGAQEETQDPRQNRVGLDLIGHRIDAPTIAWLEKMDLRTLELPAARILIAHPVAAEAEALAQGYRAAGAQVDVTPLPEYGAMMRPAWASAVPRQGLAALVEWAAQAMPTRTVKAPDPARTAVGDVVLLLPDACEQTVAIGPGRLFGVLCQPQSDCAERSVAQIAARHAEAVSKTCRPVVLITNTGGTSHVGEGRFGVTLARHLARRGYTSLRFDVAGVGDSMGRHDSAGRCEFPAMQADLHGTMDWLVEQGYTDVIVVGICSGAYLGLHAAQHPAVAGLLGVNLPGVVLPGGVATLRALGGLNEGSTGAHLQAMFKWQKWRDVARGRVRLLPVLGSMFSHAIGHARGLFGDAGRNSARGLLRLLDERGVRIRLLYSPHDIGLERLMMTVGSSRNLRKLRHLKVEVQPCLDHEVLGAQGVGIVMQQCERMLAEQLVLAAVSTVAPGVAGIVSRGNVSAARDLGALSWYALRERGPTVDLQTRK